AHQEVPFERLVAELQPERDLSRHPLFQVLFAFQNAPWERLALEGLCLEGIGVEAASTQFDLTVSLAERQEGLAGAVEYCSELFEAGTIERLVGHYQRLLEGAVAEPEQRVWELPLLSEAERHQLLVEFNGKPAEYPSERCLHQLFEEQVVR